MTRHFSSPLFAALLLALVTSCSSSSKQHGVDPALLAVAYAAPDCTCGTEQGILHGCQFEACASGAGNPDNPECFCYSPLLAGGFASGEFSAEAGSGAQAAGAGSSARERYIYLRSGKSYKGTVQSDDLKTLVILTVGGNERSIPYADLAPRTIYALHQSNVPANDFDGQMKIAAYARDNGLYGYAKRHYQRAERADKSRLAEVEQGVALLRKLASEAELVKARESLAKNDLRGARKHLVNVIEDFPGEAAAGIAQSLFDEQFERERQEDQSIASARSDAVQRALKPALKHLERARNHERKGLKESRKRTRAIHDFEDAVASARRSYELLDKLEKRESTSPELRSAIAEVKAEVMELGVNSYVYAANNYLARGSHNNAIESANAALAIDPNSEEARSVRQRAEDSLTGVGWGWGWYPGGGVGWGWGWGTPGVGAY